MDYTNKNHGETESIKHNIYEKECVKIAHATPTQLYKIKCFNIRTDGHFKYKF